jgi:hypothetical protein
LIFHNRRRLGAIRRPFVSGVVGYQGIADVVTPTYYWGVRALSAASLLAGSNIIRIVPSNTGGTIDYAAASPGGGLPAATIIADMISHSNSTPFIQALAEQVTNTLGSNPGAGGVSNPVLDTADAGIAVNMAFVAASSQYLQVTAGLSTLTQPYTLAAVLKHPLSATGQCVFSFNNGDMNCFVAGSDTTPGFVQFSAGTATSTVAMSDNHFHSLIIVANGSSSSITVDGATTSSLVAGAHNFTTSGRIANDDFGGGFLFGGNICELAVFAGNQTSNIAALFNNQKAFYGNFPI